MSEVFFKQFRSPGEDIRVASPSGHAAVITMDLTPIHRDLWPLAYAAGAVSENMSVEGEELLAYVQSQKEEIAAKEAREEQEVKAILQDIYANPVGVVDDKGKLLIRKAIAKVGRPVKSELIHRLWDEVVQEAVGE